MLGKRWVGCWGSLFFLRKGGGGGGGGGGSGGGCKRIVPADGSYQGYSMDRLRGVVKLLALVHVFLFSSHEIHGVQGKRDLLTDANVKVDETNYDDLYDCVDFYKQPAFDHPLLANHTFHPEMRPSSIPKLTISKMTDSLDMEFQMKGKNCPIGTVPIRRITFKDRTREQLHLKKYGSYYSVLTAETPGTHYAVAKTRSSPMRFKGASAKITTWNPSVQNSQYSSGQIVVRNGRDNIQVGWTVNPTLYGDKRTHLFIYTSAGATQCFNTHCPGFVIINKNIHIDGFLDVSKIDGPIAYVNYMIRKDAKDGNWWLFLNNISIGFWPKRIFTSLTDMATSIEWGGVVHSPPNVPSPPMGSGNFLAKNGQKDAYCGFVSIINEMYKVVDAVHIDAYADTSRYEIDRKANAVGDVGKILVLFGGPGGVTGN